MSVNDTPTSLLGYKGTSLIRGNEALRTKEFHISKSDESASVYHWLGNGIYFYTDKADAQLWAKSAKREGGFVIIAETIKLYSYEVYQLGDLSEEWWELKLKENEIALRALDEKENVLKIKDVQKIDISEFRHGFAESLWDKYPAVKVMTARFPDVPLKDCPKADGIDIRYKRVEFCVRRNEFINKESIKRCD